jgi:hypothetical protein
LERSQISCCERDGQIEKEEKKEKKKKKSNTFAVAVTACF